LIAKSALNHDNVSIYCALLTPQWKQSLRSSFMQVVETWSLKCSIAQLDKQNRKYTPVLIITEAKNAHFFVCKRTGFVHEELKDFVKMTLTLVSSHWMWLETSHSVKNVTRIEPSHHFSYRDSSRVRVTTNCDSSHDIPENRTHNRSHFSVSAIPWVCWGIC